MHSRPAHSRRAGFTVVEMAIVVVVIGLLIGGILIGREVMRNAQIYRLTDQYSSYVQAIGLFQKKYGALPGDFPVAETIWGSDNSCPNTPRNDPTLQLPKTATCNGDGNGKVGLFNNDTASASTQYETFRFWQHLANAGFIQGTYSGVAGPSSVLDSVFPANQPASPITGTGWFAQDLVDTDAANPTQYNIFNGLILYFGQDSATPGDILIGLSGAELQVLDQKIDDGHAGTGRVVASAGKSLTCTTTNDPETAEYKTSENRPICAPLFKMQ